MFCEVNSELLYNIQIIVSLRSLKTFEFLEWRNCSGDFILLLPLDIQFVMVILAALLQMGLKRMFERESGMCILNLSFHFAQSRYQPGM